MWSPSSVSDVLRLESVQRSFTRSLKYCSSLPYNERLLICELSSLEGRRLVADLNLFYKIVNKIITIDLGNLIQPIPSRNTRGHSKRFVIPPARINCRLHFFVNRTIPVWNSLNETTVSSNSVFSFNNLLRYENINKFLVLGF